MAQLPAQEVHVPIVSCGGPQMITQGLFKLMGVLCRNRISTSARRTQPWVTTCQYSLDIYFTLYCDQLWRRWGTATKVAAGASATETTSLASSITNYRFENGRRYHAYKEGEYWCVLVIVSVSEAPLRLTFIAGDRTTRSRMINSTSGALTHAGKAD